MRRTHLAFITITVIVAIWAAVPLRAAVTVTPTEPPKTEPPKAEPPKAEYPQGKPVALQINEKQYVTANTGGGLGAYGAKIGSKQVFAIIDLNGGDLMDGDGIKIQYTPNAGGKPDPSKASYWMEVEEGVKRGKEGGVFKIKKVGTKYAFLAPSGKFVTAMPGEEGVLLVSDKQESAMLVEFVDLSSGIPKPPKKSKAEASAAEKSAAE
jgi:hypothetical protein